MTAGEVRGGVPHEVVYLPEGWPMELSLNGVNPAQPWVTANVNQADELFWNKGVKESAMWLAALHPRALDYLETAPVLALAATFGGKTGRRQERAYVAMNFRPLIERGAKLKDIMKKFGVAYQLRAISPKAIRPGIWQLLQTITRLVEPSQIAQSIPTKPTRHMNWLGDLDTFWTALRRRTIGRNIDTRDMAGNEFIPMTNENADVLRWAMFALSRHKEISGTIAAVLEYDPLNLADFMVANRSLWNARWSWARLIRESDEWHDRIAAGDAGLDEAEYETEISYGAFPHEVTVGGYDFHALRSMKALFLEGKTMNHCVLSYYLDVTNGNSRIYSIRKNGKRLATCEFRYGPYQVSPVQIKGPNNAAPATEVRSAAAQFAACISYPKENLRGLSPATRKAFKDAAKAAGQ